jgi:predicted permease
LGYLIALVGYGIQNAGIWTGKDQRLLQKMNVVFVGTSQWTIRY